MIRQELQQLPTGASHLRRFGFLVGGVFLLLGGWFWLRGKSFYFWPLVPGMVLVAAALIYPSSLRLVYLGWMALALVLGVAVSTVLLTLFYFFVVTPIGWVARAAGRDFLHRELDPKQPSYWLDRSREKAEAPSDYERQF